MRPSCATLTFSRRVPSKLLMLLFGFVVVVCCCLLFVFRPRICSGVNEQHHVRCCATSTAPATVKPVLPAPVPPKTCKELNWSAGSTSASGVCGASQVVIGSRCLDKKVPFLVAQSLCLHIGARLCTSAELSAGLACLLCCAVPSANWQLFFSGLPESPSILICLGSAAGSGCGLDDKPVWTASEVV